jgi:hypothetical protein
MMLPYMHIMYFDICQYKLSPEKNITFQEKGQCLRPDTFIPGSPLFSCVILGRSLLSGL